MINTLIKEITSKAENQNAIILKKKEERNKTALSSLSFSSTC